MTRLDPTDPDVWQLVRSTLRHTHASSLHCAVASIGPDGAPHVTPIGSIMLTDAGRGVLPRRDQRRAWHTISTMIHASPSWRSTPGVEPGSPPWSGPASTAHRDSVSSAPPARHVPVRLFRMTTHLWPQERSLGQAASRLPRDRIGSGRSCRLDQLLELRNRW